jgi:polyisoprenoid-binding protein YceI
VRLPFALGFFITIFWNPAPAQILEPVDEGSHVEFRIKNFGSTVGGMMKGIKGEIQFNPKIVSLSKFDVSVESNTVNTGIGMRDNHLRKEEYFNVGNYPHLRFVSTNVSLSGKSGEYLMTGNLTIKNTTHSISFPFTYVDGLFTGQFQIDRRDYDVGGNSISMSDNVTVRLRIMTKTKS